MPAGAQWEWHSRGHSLAMLSKRCIERFQIENRKGKSWGLIRLRSDRKGSPDVSSAFARTEREVLRSHQPSLGPKGKSWGLIRLRSDRKGSPEVSSDFARIESSVLVFTQAWKDKLLLLLLKKVSSARLGESDIHPISPKTPAPQYQPIDRKKRKGKRVEDYSRDRAA